MSKFIISLQYIMPKLALTKLAGFLASRQHFATQWMIKKFISRYKVNMSEAIQPNASAYASFNDFFTRAIRPELRPIAYSAFICPVDGKVSQFGAIKQGQIFQAKGHQYSAATLLAGDAKLAEQFNQGDFATIYLSPKDYHRIHMPCKGELVQMLYVPGDLFSVNPQTAEQVPGLFARNERVVCIFNSEFGQFALVLVGATIVGSMATVWHGQVNPPRPNKVIRWQYSAGEVVLEQGAEMGRFMLGSTVVILFPANGIDFTKNWQAATPVKMGEVMGSSRR